MSFSPAVILYDSLGNEISNVVVGSDRCLAVSSTQNVMASAGNSSTANLAASATFPGASESSLGVAGLQVNFIASQPCTISVLQSMDNVWWDIEDSWTQDADVADARTIQATASYFKVTVTNNGPIITTYLRLQTALCPVVEAVPRSITQYGSLKVAIREQQIFSDCYESKLFSSVYEGTVANTETPFLWLRNPSGNTKDLVLHKMIIMTLQDSQGVAGRMYLNPTVTFTTGSVPITCRKQKGTPPVSTMVMYYGLTTSSNGTKVFTLYNGAGSNALIDDAQASTILGPGNDWLLTMEATAVNTKVAITAIWGEY